MDKRAKLLAERASRADRRSSAAEEPHELNDNANNAAAFTLRAVIVPSSTHPRHFNAAVPVPAAFSRVQWPFLQTLCQIRTIHLVQSTEPGEDSVLSVEGARWSVDTFLHCLSVALNIFLPAVDAGQVNAADQATALQLAANDFKTRVVATYEENGSNWFESLSLSVEPASASGNSTPTGAAHTTTAPPSRTPPFDPSPIHGRRTDSPERVHRLPLSAVVGLSAPPKLRSRPSERGHHASRSSLIGQTSSSHHRSSVDSPTRSPPRRSSYSSSAGSHQPAARERDHQYSPPLSNSSSSRFTSDHNSRGYAERRYSRSRSPVRRSSPSLPPPPSRGHLSRSRSPPRRYHPSLEHRTPLKQFGDDLSGICIRNIDGLGCFARCTSDHLTYRQLLADRVTTKYTPLNRLPLVSYSSFAPMIARVPGASDLFALSLPIVNNRKAVSELFGPKASHLFALRAALGIPRTMLLIRSDVGKDDEPDRSWLAFRFEGSAAQVDTITDFLCWMEDVAIRFFAAHFHERIKFRPYAQQIQDRVQYFTALRKSLSFRDDEWLALQPDVLARHPYQWDRTTPLSESEIEPCWTYCRQNRTNGLNCDSPYCSGVHISYRELVMKRHSTDYQDFLRFPSHAVKFSAVIARVPNCNQYAVALPVNAYHRWLERIFGFGGGKWGCVWASTLPDLTLQFPDQRSPQAKEGLGYLSLTARGPRSSVDMLIDSIADLLDNSDVVGTWHRLKNRVEWFREQKRARRELTGGRANSEQWLAFDPSLHPRLQSGITPPALPAAPTVNHSAAAPSSIPIDSISLTGNEAVCPRFALHKESSEGPVCKHPSCPQTFGSHCEYRYFFRTRLVTDFTAFSNTRRWSPDFAPVLAVHLHYPGRYAVVAPFESCRPIWNALLSTEIEDLFNELTGAQSNMNGRNEIDEHNGDGWINIQITGTHDQVDFALDMLCFLIDELTIVDKERRAPTMRERAREWYTSKQHRDPKMWMCFDPTRHEALRQLPPFDLHAPTAGVVAPVHAVDAALPSQRPQALTSSNITAAAAAAAAIEADD